MNISSIMIVDDSESDQFLTKVIIEKYDDTIEIMQAYDGQEALEQLDAIDKQPDIILLDINMPRMNGFEFLEEYNKREEKSKIIAMLTSSDQEEDKEKSIKYGCVKTYFVKPLSSDKVSMLCKL
ncbi:response regulator [Alphaproteobacteria bacterium]|nr:response regulator [Alphaproteobacteria bacterium]